MVQKRSKIQLGFRIALRLVLFVLRGGSKLKNISFAEGEPVFLKSHSFDLGALFSSKITQFWLQNESQIGQTSIQNSLEQITRICLQNGAKKEPT